MSKLDVLKEKFNALSKKQKIALLIVVFVVLPILGKITELKLETGYTRIADKVCNSANKCVEYKMFEPILVSKKTDSIYSVYKMPQYGNTPQIIGEIDAKNVVFEGTQAYEQTKQEKADIDKKEAEIQAQREAKKLAERQAQLAKLEPNMKKAYYKIDIKQFNADGSGIYDFYVSPVLWVKLKYDEKQNAFNTCVTYVQLKTNPTNPNSVKHGVKIKSSSNGAVLAEYDSFKGVKVK